MVHDQGSALARFAAVLATLDASKRLPTRLCEAGRIVLDANGAALSVEDSKERRITLSATDELAALLESFQDLVGEGPGAEASRTGKIVVGTMGDECSTRWPMFADLAEEARFTGTLFAIPVQPARVVVGVLSLYTFEGPLGEDLPTAQFVADAIGTALLHDPREMLPDEELSETWPSRARIHQATGMVVAQLGVSPQDAVALLRAQAYSRGLDLLSVAVEIIERRINFSDFTVGGD
ncbi:MAG: hypothetical protein JWP10_732 [Nocardioidaceae bacterium]|nr:hypothetical protein [Nocardioidaceae bacterium]